MKTKRQREQRAVRYASAQDAVKKHQSGRDMSYLNLPAGVPVFEFKREGVYKIRIPPYVAGKGNPSADEGLAYYERSFYIYRGIGPNRRSFCCLGKNWNLADPIAEQLEKLKAKNGYEFVKPFMPKHRQLMHIIDLEDQKKGVQIYEGPYYSGLGEVLDAKITHREKYARFFALEGGYDLEISVEPKDIGTGKPMLAPADIDMIEREDLDGSVLKKTFCLDGMLVQEEPEVLRKAFVMGGYSKPKKDQDDESDEDTEDSDLEEEDGDFGDSDLEPDDDAEDDSDLEKEEDEDGDEDSSSETEEDDDGDWDEDSEDTEEPAPKNKKGKPSPKKGK